MLESYENQEIERPSYCINHIESKNEATIFQSFIFKHTEYVIYTSES